MLTKFQYVLKLIRPHHYIKNLFIFLPIFFAAKITDFSLLSDVIIAFISFSLIASSIYTLNDYCDIEQDRQHEKKKNRPLVKGVISKQEAIFIMTILLLIGLVPITLLSFEATVVLVFYIVMNIAYSFYLKHVPIVDVTIIAIGFVLRLFVGSFVAGVHLSMWIVVMTFLLAIFIALAKRRDDVLIYQQTGKSMRLVIDGYNLKFLDSAMVIMASVVVVAYIIYTTSPEVINRSYGEYFYLTTLFVILGILKYFQITLVLKKSGSPMSVVLKNRFIQYVVLSWIVAFAWLIY